MKCQKCCAKIAENEEICSEKKYFCETCWKGDSWKRTVVSGGKVVIFTIMLFILIGFVVWFWKKEVLTNKKCDRIHDDDN